MTPLTTGDFLPFSVDRQERTQRTQSNEFTALSSRLELDIPQQLVFVPDAKGEV